MDHSECGVLRFTIARSAVEISESSGYVFPCTGPLKWQRLAGCIFRDDILTSPGKAPR